MSHSRGNLEQMLRDSIEEAEKWDLGPKNASLWWTSTYEPEESSDLSIDTKSGAIEERMQAANKAWWRDVNIYI